MAWLRWPRPVTALLLDLRPLRILHYIILAALGLALYAQTIWPAVVWTAPVAGRFLMLAVSLVYAAVFAIVTNNIEDLEADRISNPGRPLVQGVISAGTALRAGIACQLYALLAAALTHWSVLAGVSAISLGYYIYSCRPFRLKRIPIVAKLFIGFNSLALAVCGYVLAGGSWQNFPAAWLVFILVPLSLSANFVDLKDTAGDRHARVYTLPVLLGERTARLLIAASTLATYAMAAALLHIRWLYPFMGMAMLLHIALLYRRPYREKPVFIVYITALVALVFVLLYCKPA